MQRPTLIILLALAVPALPLGSAVAQEKPENFYDRFFDPQDGALDMSAILARGGFIPMPIIITEPAVDNGFGIAGYFIRNPPDGHKTPTRTILGTAKTGNGSWGGGALRSGAFGDDRILYSVSIAKGLAVLDFYPGNRDYALSYTNDITYAEARVRYRFGDSNFSLGPSLRYRSNEIALDADNFPELADYAGRTIKSPSISIEAHYDSRDNPMSPTDGLNVIADIQRFPKALGSDVEFTSTSLFSAGFATRDSWTLAAMGSAETTSDSTPFFLKPDLNLRGLARGRYKGDEVAMVELELRRQITPRWAGVGFVGHGRTYGDGASAATTFGAGIRYRIARLLGLDIGLDYAKGPEEDVFYLQFGHAWGREMD